MDVSAKDCLRVCETCPWLKKNHGKRKPIGWYTVTNLRRLWNGIRSGKAAGMICHSTDPDAHQYGGHDNIKPGKEQPCAGALSLIIMNMNALADGKPQPSQPVLKMNVVADWTWKALTKKVPSVEDRSEEIGVPW